MPKSLNDYRYHTKDDLLKELRERYTGYSDDQLWGAFRKKFPNFVPYEPDPAPNLPDPVVRSGARIGQMWNVLQEQTGLNTPEQAAEDIASLERLYQKRMTPEYIRGVQEITENVEGDWIDQIKNTTGAIVKNPAAAAGLFTEIMGIAAPTLAAAAGTAVIPGVRGTVTPLLLSALVQGLGSGYTDYALTTIDALRESGIDVSKTGDVIEAFSNPEKMTEAKTIGLKHGLPVGLLDTVGWGVAGIFGKAAVNASKIGKRALGSAALVAEGATGAGGEALGQMNVAQYKGEEPVVSDKAGVIMEALFEMPTAAFSGLTGYAKERSQGIAKDTQPTQDDAAATQVQQETSEMPPESAPNELTSPEGMSDTPYRENVLKSLTDALQGKVSQEELNANIEIVDTQMETFANANGISIDDAYKRWIKGIERGRQERTVETPEADADAVDGGSIPPASTQIEEAADIVVKGEIEINEQTGQSVIRLFDDADASTPIHEIGGHLGRRVLAELSDTHPETYGKHYENLKKFAGVREDNVWTTEAEERVARAFEKYLKTGKAPSTKLQETFRILKDALIRIYNNIKNNKVSGVKLNKKAVEAFDSLLLPENAKKAYQEKNKSIPEKILESKGITKEQYEAMSPKMQEALYKKYVEPEIQKPLDEATLSAKDKEQLIEDRLDEYIKEKYDKDFIQSLESLPNKAKSELRNDLKKEMLAEREADIEAGKREAARRDDIAKKGEKPTDTEQDIIKKSTGMTTDDFGKLSDTERNALNARLIKPEIDKINAVESAKEAKKAKALKKEPTKKQLATADDTLSKNAMLLDALNEDKLTIKQFLSWSEDTQKKYENAILPAQEARKAKPKEESTTLKQELYVNGKSINYSTPKEFLDKAKKSGASNEEITQATADDGKYRLLHFATTDKAYEDPNSITQIDPKFMGGGRAFGEERRQMDSKGNMLDGYERKANFYIKDSGATFEGHYWENAPTYLAEIEKFYIYDFDNDSNPLKTDKELVSEGYKGYKARGQIRLFNAIDVDYYGRLRTRMNPGKRSQMLTDDIDEYMVERGDYVRDRVWEKETKKSLKDSGFKSKAEFEDFIKNRRYSLLTAENPGNKRLSNKENDARNKHAKAWLTSKGYKPIDTFGKYDGKPEKSFLVPEMSKADMVEFANKFGQESVVTNKGMFYTALNTMKSRLGVDVFMQNPTDFYSAVNILGNVESFSANFDWGTDVPATLQQAELRIPPIIEVNGKRRRTINSHGRVIADTEEKIRNFWKNFDLAGATTINELGQPIVFYHGTGEDFDTFMTSGSMGFDEISLVGHHFSRDIRVADFFAEDKGVTEKEYDYAINKKGELYNAQKRKGKDDVKAANIMPVYLFINPKKVVQPKVGGVPLWDDTAVAIEIFKPLIDNTPEGKKLFIRWYQKFSKKGKYTDEAVGWIYDAAKKVRHEFGVTTPSAILAAKDSSAGYISMSDIDNIYQKFLENLQSEGYSGLEYFNTSLEETKNAIDKRAYIVFNEKLVKSAIGNVGDFDITKSSTLAQSEILSQNSTSPDNSYDKASKTPPKGFKNWNDYVSLLDKAQKASMAAGLMSNKGTPLANHIKMRIIGRESLAGATKQELNKYYEYVTKNQEEAYNLGLMHRELEVLYRNKIKDVEDLNVMASIISPKKDIYKMDALELGGVIDSLGGYLLRKESGFKGWLNRLSASFDFIKPVEKRVRTKIGKEFMKIMATINAEYKRLSARGEKILRINGVHKISNEDALIIADVIENPKLLNKYPHLRDEVAGVKKYFNLFYEAAKNAGLDFGKIENYFPRVLKPEILDALYNDIHKLTQMLSNTKNMSDEALVRALSGVASKYTTDALTALVQNGNAKTLVEASNLLRKFTKESIFKETQFEKERQLELPSSFYERDIFKVIPYYGDKMSKRIAIASDFGKDGKKAFDMLNDVRAYDIEEGNMLDSALSIFSGIDDRLLGYKGKMKKLVQLYYNFEMSTKIALGTATIPNIFQTFISTMPRFGVFDTVASGIKIVFDKKYRQMLRDETGILESKFFQEYMGIDSDDSFTSRLADKLATLSGFKGINKFNLYLSAATAYRVLPKWVNQSKSSSKKGLVMRQRLKEDFGIDVENFKEDDLLNAVFEFSTNSQLQKNVLKEPLWFNHPKVKPLLMFKRFGYRQFNFMAELLIKEAKRGNYFPIIQLATLAPLAGMGSGELKEWYLKLFGSDNVQNIKDLNKFQEYVEHISALGAFGVVSDILSINKMSEAMGTISFALKPVIIADIEKLADAYTKYMLDYENYGDAFLATKRNLYQFPAFFGSVPRAMSKKLMTTPQKENRLRYYRTKVKNEIIELLLDGKYQRARALTVKWNSSNKDNPITYSDVNSAALRDYVKRFERKVQNARK